MPRISVEQEADKKRVQAKLKALAEEISSDLSALEAEQSRELLSDFVSELFLAAAEQKKRAERRRKQAEGIAAAKAKGVRFGPSRKPLPDDFDRCYQAWRDGELSLAEAAESCGMARASFRRAAARREEAGRCAS